MHVSYVPTRLYTGCCTLLTYLIALKTGVCYVFVFSPEEVWAISALTVEMSESYQYLVTIFASSATNPATQRRAPELSVINHWHWSLEGLEIFILQKTHTSLGHDPSNLPL